MLPEMLNPVGFAGATATGCVITTVPGASVTGTVTSGMTWISMGAVCPPIMTVFGGGSAITRGESSTASSANG
ncbi:hypothetical protein D3C83_96910 [compost metagenome]